MRPRLLDTFCCQGGCSMGYRWAGFDVVGVDHEPQPPIALRREASGLYWMSTHGVDQAIPPAYTEWLGRQLLEVLGA